MNELFKDLIATGKVVIYMDDILIATKDIKEHRQLVKQVLQRLQDNDLYLKPEKCFFEREEIEYLGLIISHGHTRMDPVKVRGISEWPQPRNLKQVRGFLGFANFYRRFIKDFARIARPLNDLTKKNVPFLWSTTCADAFTKLKDIFVSAPVLIQFDHTKQSFVDTDGSGFASGAVLSQEGDDGLLHPCAYESHSFSEAERNYDIYDRELLAVIRAFEIWRHYLEGAQHTIVVRTDHRNLTYFRKAQKTQPTTSAMVAVPHPIPLCTATCTRNSDGGTRRAVETSRSQ